MIEVQILIPINDNQGNPYPAETHADFELMLNILFVGHSLLPALVAGEWINDDILYADQSRIYSVSFESIRDGGKVGEAVDFAKALYGQLAIYIRYLGLSETL